MCPIHQDPCPLYTPQARTGPGGPADQALAHLSQAWQALLSLEESLSQDLARWDAESLTTARKGTQRAWLALSNLNRSLGTRQKRGDSGGSDVRP